MYSVCSSLSVDEAIGDVWRGSFPLPSETSGASHVAASGMYLVVRGMERLEENFHYCD